MDILHGNIYVHSRRLIDKLPGDAVKFISKKKYHRANMKLSDKSRHDRLF